MADPPSPLPSSIAHLFEELSHGHPSIHPPDLAAFLSSSQAEPSSSEELAASLISQFHLTQSPSLPPSSSLDLHDFLLFLLSPQLNPLLQPSEQATQDMTAPLPHYFIYSSHNSYLSGNQLTSDSSTSVIERALQNGCRVIELDCWNRNGEIMVLHGHTLTKPIAFEDCVRAIKENAFRTSDYPVIITLENHLQPDLQTKAAIILRDILGDLLFVPSADEKPPRTFASPEDLRHKIIISDTPPKETWHGQAVEDPQVMIETFPFFIPSDLKPEEDSPPPSPNALSMATLGLTKQIVSAADTVSKKIPFSQTDEPLKRVDDLEDIIYIYSEKLDETGTTEDGALRAGNRAIMSNLSEPQVRKQVEQNASSLIKFSQNNLGRMYPFGLRFDSSNADPYLAWTHGFQLAALNMQANDRACWVAQALFDGNGRCGYVRKPSYLVSDEEVDLAKIEPKLLLQVKIVMGTNMGAISRERQPDVYVKVALDGVPLDKARRTTKVAHNNTTPSWENELFEFSIRVPELAILRLEAWDADRLRKDDFIGQACVSINEIRTGFRAINLRSPSGENLPSTILCWVKKELI